MMQQEPKNGDYVKYIEDYILNKTKKLKSTNMPQSGTFASAKSKRINQKDHSFNQSKTNNKANSNGFSGKSNERVRAQKSGFNVISEYFGIMLFIVVLIIYFFVI